MKGVSTEQKASIQKRVRALYEEGASIDQIEAKMLELYADNDVEGYLASGIRALVVDEIDALRRGRGSMKPGSAT